MKNVYFAGGYYEQPVLKNIHGSKMTMEFETKPAVFGMVHGANDKRPYLTGRLNGLQMTSHHANLYGLSDDGKVAVLADFRCAEAGCDKYIALTEEQQKLIQESIKTNYYFD